jgi:alcohol dehydrogenase (cytochrome c)
VPPKADSDNQCRCSTGTIKKSIHLRSPNYSGALSNAGGFIFLGLSDRTFAAFDDTSLGESWNIDVGSGFNAPPMTFEVDGRQYVAILSGPSATARRELVNTPEYKE